MVKITKNIIPIKKVIKKTRRNTTKKRIKQINEKITFVKALYTSTKPEIMKIKVKNKKLKILLDIKKTNRLINLQGLRDNISQDRFTVLNQKLESSEITNKISLLNKKMYNNNKFKQRRYFSSSSNAIVTTQANNPTTMEMIINFPVNHPYITATVGLSIGIGAGIYYREPLIKLFSWKKKEEDNKKDGKKEDKNSSSEDEDEETNENIESEKSTEDAYNFFDALENESKFFNTIENESKIFDRHFLEKINNKKKSKINENIEEFSDLTDLEEYKKETELKELELKELESIKDLIGKIQENIPEVINAEQRLYHYYNNPHALQESLNEIKIRLFDVNAFIKILKTKINITENAVLQRHPEIRELLTKLSNEQDKNIIELERIKEIFINHHTIIKDITNKIFEGDFKIIKTTFRTDDAKLIDVLNFQLNYVEKEAFQIVKVDKIRMISECMQQAADDYTNRRINLNQFMEMNINDLMEMDLKEEVKINENLPKIMDLILENNLIDLPTFENFSDCSEDEFNYENYGNGIEEIISNLFSDFFKLFKSFSFFFFFLLILLSIYSIINYIKKKNLKKKARIKNVTYLIKKVQINKLEQRRYFSSFERIKESSSFPLIDTKNMVMEQNPIVSDILTNIYEHHPYLLLPAIFIGLGSIIYYKIKTNIEENRLAAEAAEQKKLEEILKAKEEFLKQLDVTELFEKTAKLGVHIQAIKDDFHLGFSYLEQLKRDLTRFPANSQDANKILKRIQYAEFKLQGFIQELIEINAKYSADYPEFYRFITTASNEAIHPNIYMEKFLRVTDISFCIQRLYYIDLKIREIFVDQFLTNSNIRNTISRLIKKDDAFANYTIYEQYELSQMIRLFLDLFEKKMPNIVKETEIIPFTINHFLFDFFNNIFRSISNIIKEFLNIFFQFEHLYLYLGIIIYILFIYYIFFRNIEKKKL